MSPPAGSGRPPKGDWQSLDPFEKAAQWREADPKGADKLLELAEKRGNAEMERDRRQAEHKMELERSQAKHLESMDIRLWRTQLIGIVGGLLCIGGLIAVAWHYADSGNLVPGLGIFGIGSGLTAAVYGVGRSISNEMPAKKRSRT